ncbi:hypothetical protein B0H10DRAFT_333937 [Mycena sp. CBHHK59/15]|nr:hypothetical protein B0H10DRAFT_333937 [Mycena sp. CBHHK59/15]
MKTKKRRKKANVSPPPSFAQPGNISGAARVASSDRRSVTVSHSEILGSGQKNDSVQ